jgi:xanthine dehydrogenase small subunit
MSQPIQFLLNGTPHTVSDVDPHTTLLQYLREHLHITGSKEGCAEGDCGACTIVLGQLQADGRVSLVPINACIRLLPTLDGKAVFTVESLQPTAAGASLHPVQQAMVNCHASQCGFCTPGFVMALFALFKNEAMPSRERTCEAIAGNLCRCTGYRPILDAAQAMYELAESNATESAISSGSQADQKFVQWMCTANTANMNALEQEDVLANALKQLQRVESLDYVSSNARFIAPRSVDEFSEIIAANPNAWILGGGTDIGLWITKALQTNALIVYSGEVRTLHAITETDSAITIGAATSLESAFRAMNRIYPELAHVWTRFASASIRASGTLGGNVANGSPIGDSMPALIALNANVVLRKGAVQRTIPLESLYIDYKKQARQMGEWVEAIVIPKREDALMMASYKNSKRNEQDISAVCAAIALRVDHGVVVHCRIAYGGMAGIPKRALNVENALLGKAWTESVVRDAMRAMNDDFKPLSDMRASAEYRMQIAQNHLLRFWYESQGESAEARVF